MWNLKEKTKDLLWFMNACHISQNVFNSESIFAILFFLKNIHYRVLPLNYFFRIFSGISLNRRISEAWRKVPNDDPFNNVACCTILHITLTQPSPVTRKIMSESSVKSQFSRRVCKHELRLWKINCCYRFCE